MHAEAYKGFGQMVRHLDLDHAEGLRVLDMGGQDVNSTGQGLVVYDFFDRAQVTTLDLYRADIIADAATWEPDRSFDVVMATELFEHTPAWKDIIAVMHRALDPHGAGAFLSTCASLHRPPHGAHGDPLPRHGEWYGNVPAYLLHSELQRHFRVSDVKYQNPPGDAYAWALL